jgi:hypothetical protein
VVIFIGDGGFNPLKLKPVEAIQMTLFLATCAGLIIAWRWPFIGGAIATSAILLFFAVEFAMTGGFPKGVIFLLMLFPCAFFMLSGFLKRRRFAR